MATEKIKIAYIIPSLGMGGAERLAIDICNELNGRQEVEYVLVSLDPKNEYPLLTQDVHWKICKTKTELDLIIQTFNPHIIHSHIYYADIISREKIYPNIIYVSHVHGRTTQYEKFLLKDIFVLNKQRIYKLFERRKMLNVYKKCNNHFLTVSTFYQEYLAYHLNVPDKKIKVIPNAVNRRTFSSTKDKTISTQAINLITVGRLTKQKNHEVLIDVIDQLNKQHIHATLTIIGEGSELESLKNKTSSLELNEKIIFKPANEQVNLFLNDATFYVHSAKEEAFGLTMLEAMACGLPVITCSEGGCNEFILDGFNGYRLTSCLVDAFYNKIIELSKQPEIYQHLSKNAIETSKHFGISSYVNTLLSWYHLLLSKTF